MHYRKNRGSTCTHTVKLLSCVWLFATPWTYQGPTRPLRSWDFPGKGTRVGCHFLLHKQRPKEKPRLYVYKAVIRRPGSTPTSTYTTRTFTYTSWYWVPPHSHSVSEHQVKSLDGHPHLAAVRPLSFSWDQKRPSGESGLLLLPSSNNSILTSVRWDQVRSWNCSPQWAGAHSLWQ